jgi:hypothetical protein
MIAGLLAQGAAWPLENLENKPTYTTIERFPHIGMRRAAISILLVLFLAVETEGTNYYVSPSGDDDNDGLDSTTAWLSIDNGDQKDLLAPGDTINILSGSYTISSDVQLNTFGTSLQPIVYRKLGKGKAIVNGNDQSNILITMEGNHTVVEGLELINAKDDAVYITADSCTVARCYVHDAGRHGIRVEGSNNLILRNVIAFCTDVGIKNEDAGLNNRYNNNTIYYNDKNGIELKAGVKTARIFNNIIASNDKGIKGKFENVCAFNNVWGNPGGDYVDGVTEIFLPAGRPSVESQSLPVQIAFPGQTGLIILDGDLSYNSSIAQGDVSINGIRGQILKRTTTGLSPATGDEVFDAVHLHLNNQLVASDTSLVDDNLLLQFESGYDLVRGAGCAMTITCDIKNSASLGNYVIRFTDSSFLDISDKNLLNTVYPTLTGQSYPLLSAEISVSSASLEESFTNYPNPFNPARGEQTTIGYVLVEDAYVDIEIFSITGQAVKQIAMNAFREATSHQSDTWSGINDIGREVVPGTYFCRITARYGSGRVESYRSKIAVIR